MAEGDQSNMIIGLANSGNYDAILIDNRGYGYGRGFFIGIVTFKVIS